MTDAKKPAAQAAVVVPTVDITVSWGGHRLTPIPYNSFEAPTISVTLPGVPRDQMESAIEKLYTKLEVQGRALFERKLQEHARMLKEATDRLGNYAR